MSVNAREQQFDHIELFGKPALLTNSRINRATVPEGIYCYDLRGSDYDPGKPVTVENNVTVNHAATVLTAEPIKFQKGKDCRRINNKMDFLGESITLAEFCEQHELSLQPDPRKFVLRPASPDEVGLFYSQMEPEKDAELATVGHLRLDFGHNGGEFWATWNPHNDAAFHTPVFRAELDEFVNELRTVGPLQSLGEMQSYCVAAFDHMAKQEIADMVGLTQEEAQRIADTRWYEGKTAEKIVDFQLYEPQLCMPLDKFRKAVETALGHPIMEDESLIGNRELQMEYRNYKEDSPQEDASGMTMAQSL